MRRKSTRCLTCGAPALYSYVGVISCSSCKMFFKRNAEKKQKVFKCSYNNRCEVNEINRHVCSSCRLKKCFINGMKVEMLRSSQSKTTEQNRKRKSAAKSTSLKGSDTHEQFPTRNILQSDQSTLTIDQWMLLSNLVQFYDEYNGILLAEHFVCEQTALPLKLRFKCSSVRQFIASLLSKTRFLFEKNGDFLSLCSHDRSILLHISIRSITIFSAIFTVRQSRLLDRSGFLQSTEALFGPTAWNLLKRLTDQLDFDLTFIKLILSILFFSTTNCTIYTSTDAINFMNIKTIIHVHDRYVELAWRYFLDKYNYHEAVICFSKLVSCLLTLSTILVEVYEDKSLTNITDSIVEQTKQTLVRFD